MVFVHSEQKFGIKTGRTVERNSEILDGEDVDVLRGPEIKLILIMNNDRLIKTERE